MRCRPGRRSTWDASIVSERAPRRRQPSPVLRPCRDNPAHSGCHAMTRSFTASWRPVAEMRGDVNGNRSFIFPPSTYARWVRVQIEAIRRRPAAPRRDRGVRGRDGRPRHVRRRLCEAGAAGSEAELPHIGRASAWVEAVSRRGREAPAGQLRRRRRVSDVRRQWWNGGC